MLSEVTTHKRSIALVFEIKDVALEGLPNPSCRPTSPDKIE